MRRFWDQLTKSQKNIVLAGALFAAVALLLQLAILPYFEAKQKVQRAIAASEKTLREMAVLGAEYGRIRQQSAEIRRMLERRPAGFALFSYLERKAGEAGVKGNIRGITPLKSTPSATYEEVAVEMRLDRLTMKQLTDFLYQVESLEELIRIRKISLAKMKEAPDHLSALIQIFTYQPLTPGSR
jgi:type II secretory pathway component PulM